MRTYLYCEAGFVDKSQWLPNSWVNGMNVDIHLEQLPHAFTLIVISSICFSALAFVVFRKIRWF